MKSSKYDVIIIGGGPAGLTAALYLGRARKSVVVLDRGSPRHAVSEGVHNFLTRDGLPPAALRQTAWSQMSTYPSVDRETTTVTSLWREGESWIACTQDDVRLEGRAALLATGVIDEHPPLPGYQERWGHSIHHCAYCHGWELQGLPLAVLASGEAAGHMAPLLRGWSDDVVLLTHGGELAPETQELVERAGVRVFDVPIRTLEGAGRELAEIHLEDGTTLQRRGLFVMPTQRQVPVVESTGVATTAEGHVEVDPFGATSLPMLWAAGDLTTHYQQVIEAAAQGGRAAVMINGTLTVG